MKTAIRTADITPDAANHARQMIEWKLGQIANSVRALQHGTDGFTPTLDQFADIYSELSRIADRLDYIDGMLAE